MQKSHNSKGKPIPETTATTLFIFLLAASRVPRADVKAMARTLETPRCWLAQTTLRVHKGREASYVVQYID